MAAKKFAHHFVPHNHEETGSQHRGHALENRALFAYLLIFAITVSGFWLIRVGAPQILGSASYSAEQIIALTNIKRAENGLPSLSTNNKLISAARAKSADMFSNNYWAHFSPKGTAPWSFITASGYRYIFAGENLARDFNDAQSVVNAWMNSSSHRSNLLDKNFKEIGVSVSGGKLEGKEGVLVVQMFGTAVSQVPTKRPLAEAELGESTKEEQEKLSVLPSPSGITAVADISPNQNIGEPDNITSEGSFTQENDGFGGGAATVLASRQFSISKIVSLILVGFVFFLFALEVAVAGKKRSLQIKSSTLAHLGILALTLFAVWYAVSGAVI